MGSLAQRTFKILYRDEKTNDPRPMPIALCAYQSTKVLPKHLVVDKACMKGPYDAQQLKTRMVGATRIDLLRAAGSDEEGRGRLLELQERVLRDYIVAIDVRKLPAMLFPDDTAKELENRKRYNVAIGGTIYLVDGKTIYHRPSLKRSGSDMRRSASSSLPGPVAGGALSRVQSMQRQPSRQQPSPRAQPRQRDEHPSSTVGRTASTPPISGAADAKMKVNTEFLETFAHAHKPWAFGAIAELVGQQGRCFQCTALGPGGVTALDISALTPPGLQSSSVSGGQLEGCGGEVALNRCRAGPDKLAG